MRLKTFIACVALMLSYLIVTHANGQAPFSTDIVMEHKVWVDQYIREHGADFGRGDSPEYRRCLWNQFAATHKLEKIGQFEAFLLTEHDIVRTMLMVKAKLGVTPEPDMVRRGKVTVEE